MKSFKKLFLNFVFTFFLVINTNAGIVDGYAHKQSYNTEDTVLLFINADKPHWNYKMYILNVNGERVDSLNSKVISQIPTSANAWENGFNYSNPIAYVIPKNFKSGWYTIENKIFFIVKNSNKDAAITVVYPSNSIAAYNVAGGKSLYDHSSAGTRSYKVSFQRPIEGADAEMQTNMSLGFIKWIANYSAASVQYISDIDLDDYENIEHSKVVVIIGHSEYWTRDARLNFDKFVSKGKNAIILSGNTMWWQVRYDHAKNQLICYKDINADPEKNIKLKTIIWPNSLLQYPVMNSIGADWVHGAYTDDPITHGYYGFKIVASESPIFKNTNLNCLDILSCRSVECDGTLLIKKDTNNPIVDKDSLGFYKCELLAYDYGAGQKNSSYGFGTFMVFQKDQKSGIIINTSSSNWCANSKLTASGGFGGKDSNNIKVITENMLDILVNTKAAFTADIKCNSEEIDHKELFLLYPNPNKGVFSIFCNEKSDANIKIYNSSGAFVFSKPLVFGENKVEIPSFPPGYYIYSISSQNYNIFNGKLVIY